MRSHLCGEVKGDCEGLEVEVYGWVHRRRDHGGVIFLDVRDHSGILQVVFDPDFKDSFEVADSVRNEYVLRATGRVRKRPAGSENPDMVTGEVEVLGSDLEVLNEDQKHGVVIALRAMEAPLRQIATNAGQEASVVANTVKNGEGNYGYNAGNDTYGDMLEMGILDPTKVTRSALQFAASIAGLMITTEAMVSEIPQDSAPDMGGMGGGMGGMGGMM